MKRSRATARIAASTRVLDPAPLELLDDHPLARFRQVHRHHADLYPISMSIIPAGYIIG